jgi:tetratricopeptide (TPR) repeat protein
MRWLVYLWLLLLPLVARADITAEARAAAEAHHKQATKFYEAKRYDLARIEFEAAFALTQEPDVLYNVVMCWEREGDVRQQIASLERYCQMKPDDAAAAQKLARLKESVAAMQAPTIPKAPPTTPDPKDSEAPPLVAAPKPDGKTAPALSTRRKVAIALMGTGAAFLVGALGAGIAADLDRRALQTGELTYREAQTTASRATTERTLAISFGVVGGVLAAGGIPLFLLR